MMEKIKCPNCGHIFDVEEALTDKFRAHLEKEYEKKLSAQAKKFKSEKEQLEKERAELERLREEQDEVLKFELKKLLNKEKRAMNRIWAEREKQIWIVQESIASLFGSIKGIAGKELKSAGVLELTGKVIED